MQPRERIKVAIMAACCNYAPFSALAAEERETLVRRVEKGINNQTVYWCVARALPRSFNDRAFVLQYSANSARVIANLDCKGSVNSTYLVSRLVSGEQSPYDIAAMPAVELCPDATAAARADIAQRQAQRIEHKLTRLHICPKCKHNEATADEYHSRAADEASTHSFQCLRCKHIWR